MVYREQLSKIYRDLKEQKCQFLKERKTLPEGYLNIRTYSNRKYYTWQIPKKGKQKKDIRKGITNDKEQISKLVRKRYIDGALVNIEKDISLMEGILKEYKNIDEAAVMRGFIYKHPELKDGLRYGNMTNEEMIDHPGVRRVPDFKIRRPRDGKIFYWEHMGLVTDVAYHDKNIRKLKQYATIGINPWDNLIITFAQEDGGIDVKKIDAIIQGWLL